MRATVKPWIIVTEADYRRLTSLAMAARNRSPEAAEALQEEMERAVVTDENSISPAVVRMGSFVTFTSGPGTMRRLQLVYPADEDIARDRLSVLTPIGTALVGLAPGQSIEWQARNGGIHELTVVSVSPPLE